MSVTFQPTEPGVAYEYAVMLDGRRIGRVHKQDSPSWPYAPTGKWVAVAFGCRIKGGFATRAAAAAWVQSFEPRATHIREGNGGQWRLCQPNGDLISVHPDLNAARIALRALPLARTD